MERVWRNMIIGIGAVVLIGVIAYQWVVVAPRRRMDRFLAEISRIEMGSTKFEDWRRRLNDAHIRGASISCDAGDCSDQAITENAQFQLLHKLRLAPLSGMQATVTFKGGIASEAQALVEVDCQRSLGVRLGSCRNGLWRFQRATNQGIRHRYRLFDRNWRLQTSRCDSPACIWEIAIELSGHLDIPRAWRGG